MTNIGIIVVTESTRFIMEVNKISQSDLSVNVRSQTKKEADRWTKVLTEEQRHTIHLLTLQEGIK